MDTMNFKGDLPEQCPPKDARKPNTGEVVYRLGGIENTYNETDFLSHWDRYIDKKSSLRYSSWGVSSKVFVCIYL